MSKLIKISAVYAIISGIAMYVLWGIFYATGFVVKEVSATPVSFYILIGAECLTATLLLVSGFGLFAKQKWALRLFFISMGMMLYAVIFATGQFSQRGNFGLVGFFAVIATATAFLLALHIANKDVS
jgi:hypothetical protein